MKRTDKKEKRLRVLAAAREIFEETGKIDIGLRAIAARTNQTTGAIYNHFKGKDEILAALLEQSLNRLFERVSKAAQKYPDDPKIALKASATAFFEHYRENPFEQKLGLYQFEGAPDTDLGKSADSHLNMELSKTVNVFEEQYFFLSNDRSTAANKSAALFSALIGVSIIATLHRDRSLGTTANKILDTTIEFFIN